MEAMYYEKVKEGGLRCRLCPHTCIIQEGKTGICKVRRNTGGILMAETWGKLSAINIDPVEKKPLYHFHPGKSILSLGSVGCNMKCRCCQNWQISQISAVDYALKKEIEPEEVVRLALSYKDNIGIAYTYNEPTIWFEYMLATARLVKSHGMKNVMVSNGYIGEEPLQELLRWLDAFNIDLKGFANDFYKTFTGATLDPVLRTLQQIRKSGKHLEITNLVIPSVNDNPVKFKEMVKWIADKLGANTVLHLSRYHPDYKLTNEPTPATQLEKLYEIAHEKLSYVYVGNILLSRFQDTHCSNCGELLVARLGYQVSLGSITDKGSCGSCGHQVISF